MRWLKLILETLFWCVAAAAAMLVAALVVGFAFKPVMGYIAALAVVALLPLILRMARLVRSRRATILLTYLDQAVRLNLPLPRMLAAAATSEKGVMALRLMHVRTLIEEGAPLGAALEAAVPELPRRDASIIAGAERIGRLRGGLERCLRERQLELRKSSMDDQVFYRAYPLVMIVVLSSVIGVFSVFVMPKFEQIFKDFGVKLPGMTITVLELARTVGPLLVFLAIVAVLLASALSLWHAIHPVRAGMLVSRGVRDRVFWWLPILHGLERDRGLADAFDLLAEALAVATPIDRAFAEAAGLRVNVVLRRRLERWAAAVASGMSVGDGARVASMPPLVTGMLTNVSATASAADVFGFLARYYRTRFSRTAALVEGAMVPVVVLVFGFFVACVALAMFMPLITLIQNLSGTSAGWRL